MRTRSGSKRPNNSSDKYRGKDRKMKPIHECQNGSQSETLNRSVTLADISAAGVDQPLQRANTRGLLGKKKQENGSHQYDCVDMPECGPKQNGEQAVDMRVKWNGSDAEGCTQDADALLYSGDEMDGSDWEDCPIPRFDAVGSHQSDGIKELIIEFSEPPDPVRQKHIRRATAADKEMAELVHKVHLLCLLARGRIIDSACDDPLIQAALLSLLPSDLLKISELSKLTANALSPLVRWFHSNFHVRSSASAKRLFRSTLAVALESREGTSEELAALSVALFRALKLTTRFVSILDVASLKPAADKYESSTGSKLGRGIFNTSTLMVARQEEVSASTDKSSLCNENSDVCETSFRGSYKRNDGSSTSEKAQYRDSSADDELKDMRLDSLTCNAQSDVSEALLTSKPHNSKRKGDLEFEMQLEMALSATAVGTSNCEKGSDLKILNSELSDVSPQLKRIKSIQTVDSPTYCQGISTAVGSRKVGSPSYWAEVYCSGENLTGKWVHVDAVNAIIDGEQKVEAAAAACKTFLRYVVAFAGGGAKDVTRRYCMNWHKIASKRVDSLWWGAVLAPLRQLETGATGDAVDLEKEHTDASNEHDKAEATSRSDYPTQDGPRTLGDLPIDVESSARSSFVANRSSLEDMELETRALTEPLPTNQQAYRNHELYAIERWLKKYQILHPKGPVLGFCSGHPVYPRTCVQTLRTKERWLREGLQVKANELPAKVLKRSLKLKKVQDFDAVDCGEADSEGTIELYGRWQLEPVHLPHAVNGIVPKNERGQVEVWSEKCLPPGTVHLRFPRIFYVAKRLEIDYAPAMVGFEFKNGRSIPVFDGIVVCAEFKDAILDAYAEEEERREAEEKKRNEAQAISRWYQLLSSILTRQKLNNWYGEGLSSRISSEHKTINDKLDAPSTGSSEYKESQGYQQGDAQGPKFDTLSVSLTEDHEHVFLKEDQSFDQENSVRTKRCHCGFSVQVEEL